MSALDDWKPSDLQVLEEARAQQNLYSYNAVRMQTRFRRLQRLMVWVGVSGSLMVVLQAQFIDSPDLEKALLGRLTHGLIVIIPIFLVMLVSAATHYRPGEKWILLRTASESTKAEIFKFRTRTGIYSNQLDRAKGFSLATAAMVPGDPPTLKKEKEKNEEAGQNGENAEVDSAPEDDGTSPSTPTVISHSDCRNNSIGTGARSLASSGSRTDATSQFGSSEAWGRPSPHSAATSGSR